MTNANNELWRAGQGVLFGYTENKDLMQRIKRYKFKRGWKIVADYTKDGKLIALQYRIPVEQRRVAERMFQTETLDE